MIAPFCKRLLLSCLAVLVTAGTALAADVTITAKTPDELQQKLLEAAKNKVKKVRIAPGVIRGGATGRDHLLFLKGLQDMEIDAAGVTLAGTDPTKGGVFLRDCRRVTLRGLLYYNEVPPFTQGRVLKFDEKQSTLEVEIDAGYPAPDADSVGYLFDPETRRWKPGVYDIYYNKVFKRSGRVYGIRVNADMPAKLKTDLTPGRDLIAIRGKQGKMAITFDVCEGCRLEKVTIKSAGVFGVQESGGNGGNYYNYTLTYGPRPKGASSDPLISSVADAFHSGGALKGPTLEGCVLEGMCDDAVPIHSSYALVVQAAGRKLYYVARRNANQFKPGMRIRLFDPEQRFLAEAVVKTTGKAERDFRLPHLPADKLVYYRLESDRDLPVIPAGARLSTPDTAGRGFVVRNCVIRNHRARGFLIKADDGLIENNLVEGSTIAGLIATPQFGWNESCYSRNLTIRNNIFRNTAYSTGVTKPDSYVPGAFSIKSDAPSKGPAGYGHRNIRIIGNTFENQDGMNMHLDNVQDILIEGNRFIRPHRNPCDRGRARGYNPDALIFVDNAERVTFRDNRVEAPGPYLKKLLEIGKNTADITGAGDGIVIQKER